MTGADVAPVLDIRTLAKAMQMTPYRAVRYLETSGVPVKRQGRGSPRTVLLIDLRLAFPQLFQSIEEAAHLGRARRG